MPMITPALRHAAAAPTNSSIAAASSSTATLDVQPLSPLPRIPLDAATLARIAEPVKRISSEEDVERWKQSESYAIYLLFLQRVCEASVGKPTRLPTSPPKDADGTRLNKLISLLYTLDAWTDEIEPQSRPQRFGNLAFRDWGARLAERVDALHADLLPQRLQPFGRELRAYLLDSFGSFTRIDYGSGHELAFFAWVCMLYRLGFFDGADEEGTVANVEVEENIGLHIFPLYLMVVWRLQDRYGLEPAGSHGVWGLDDFQFLPYVIGAAQLRTQSALRPAQIVAVSLRDQPTDPLTLISHPLHLLHADAVTPNLYLTSLLRIQALKRGPFHEHSPLLHDIATTVPNWVKVHGGMLKMYCAECLGKKVVVQHFPFGGVGFVWSDSVRQAVAAAPVARGGATGMALGGERGNMGSMGVPTARVTRPGAASVAGARLGHALGLGPRPGQVGRPPGAMQPPTSAVSVASAASTFPPLTRPAPPRSKPASEDQAS